MTQNNYGIYMSSNPSLSLQREEIVPTASTLPCHIMVESHMTNSKAGNVGVFSVISQKKSKFVGFIFCILSCGRFLLFCSNNKSYIAYCEQKLVASE